MIIKIIKCNANASIAAHGRQRRQTEGRLNPGPTGRNADRRPGGAQKCSGSAVKPLSPWLTQRTDASERSLGHKAGARAAKSNSPSAQPRGRRAFSPKRKDTLWRCQNMLARLACARRFVRQLAASELFLKWRASCRSVASSLKAVKSLRNLDRWEV